MAKWPNWRRKPNSTLPACHGTEWVLQTHRAWQIPRCGRCGLLMLRLGDCAVTRLQAARRLVRETGEARPWQIRRPSPPGQTLAPGRPLPSERATLRR